MDRGTWWTTVHGVTKSQEVLINHDNKAPIHPPIHPTKPPQPHASGGWVPGHSNEHGGLGAGTQR